MELTSDNYTITMLLSGMGVLASALIYMFHKYERIVRKQMTQTTGYLITLDKILSSQDSYSNISKESIEEIRKLREAITSNNCKYAQFKEFNK
tara:strand:- start:300 stop:578 length:279 start_codon:yes stop_codon:yes gene_type:complete